MNIKIKKEDMQLRRRAYEELLQGSTETLNRLDNQGKQIVLEAYQERQSKFI